MNCIKNLCINTPTPLNKTIARLTCVLAVTAIALSVIGLIASSGGPFKAIVQLGTTSNGILLGTSIFILILDLAWIAALNKKKKEIPIVLPDLPSTISSISPSQPRDGDSSAFHANRMDSEKPSVEEKKLDSFNKEELDPFNRLSDELLVSIFSYLDAYELGSSCLVSKSWNRLASDKKLWNNLDLRKILPSLKIFDESNWLEYSSFLEISVEDIPPLDKRKIIPILKRMSSLPTEGNKEITLLTIPKDLTEEKVNRIKKFIIEKYYTNNPDERIFNHDGHVPFFPRIDGLMLSLGMIKNPAELGMEDILVNRTYRIAVTNFVLSEGQQVIGQNLINLMGYQLPNDLEMDTLATFIHMDSENGSLDPDFDFLLKLMLNEIMVLKLP